MLLDDAAQDATQTTGGLRLVDQWLQRSNNGQRRANVGFAWSMTSDTDSILPAFFLADFMNTSCTATKSPYKFLREFMHPSRCKHAKGCTSPYISHMVANQLGPVRASSGGAALLCSSSGLQTEGVSSRFKGGFVCFAVHACIGQAAVPNQAPWLHCCST